MKMEDKDNREINPMQYEKESLAIMSCHVSGAYSEFCTYLFLFFFFKKLIRGEEI